MSQILGSFLSVSRVLTLGIFFKQRQNVLHRFHLILRELMRHSLPEKCSDSCILLEIGKYRKKHKIKNEARVKKIEFSAR